MTNLIPQNVTGTLQVKSVDDLSRLSVMLAKSGYFSDSKEAAQAGVKVLAGLEMGFGAVASMSGIHIIKGKPTIGANLMAAAVKRSGKYNYRITQHTEETCIITFYENNEVVGQSTFSIEDARKAGVAGNDIWRKHARNMLFSRAISNGVRWYCPDVLLGVCTYTPEEMGAQVDEEGNAINVPTVNHSEPRLSAAKNNKNLVIEEEDEIDFGEIPCADNTIIDRDNPVEFDRNLINAEIESIIRRKNISIETARNLLAELFNVRSRSLLTDKQLLQFLDCLKSSNSVAA